eukprot:TRINITY_DN1890_c0_g1_i1.p1 TRINITY_DN1890_c0_g1~~TRINITY_DN1890_c0_g1_i1.p1  ORF type:complete len:190 (+),score=18.45 TRINITY_DN1890_c0_g1_i1:67-570(+)
MKSIVFALATLALLFGVVQCGPATPLCTQSVGSSSFCGITSAPKICTPGGLVVNFTQYTQAAYTNSANHYNASESCPNVPSAPPQSYTKDAFCYTSETCKTDNDCLQFRFCYSDCTKCISTPGYCDNLVTQGYVAPANDNDCTTYFGSSSTVAVGALSLIALLVVLF